jgi:hypothetical protein
VPDGPFDDRKSHNARRIGAEVEARDLIGHLIARGQNQDRHGQPVLAKLPQHAEPIALGQHQVEDDEVVRRLLQEAIEGFGPIAGQGHGVALLLEPLPDKVGDLPLVFGDENPHISRCAREQG